LNILPDSDEYKCLIGTWNFIDLAEGSATKTKKCNSNLKPNITVDYILAKPAFGCFHSNNRYRLSGKNNVLKHGENPSDHEPILAEIAFDFLE
jgi:hypothetical protein